MYIQPLHYAKNSTQRHIFKVITAGENLDNFIEAIPFNPTPWIYAFSTKHWRKV